MSYKWGNCRQLRTTIDTVEERCHSIPIEQMPQTLRDVVELTRSLGIQYLWIDALCIVQDSEEDCVQELSVMFEIYAQSTLTIAAVGSYNADDGCAPCRNKLALSTCNISKQDYIQPYERRKDFSLLDSQSLHRRAWCLQETEISPRLLSVGADQLYWQCREAVCRESNPTAVYSPELLSKSATTGHWPFVKRTFDHNATSSSFKSYVSWYMLVERYSQRQITFRNDKMPAISALAKQFATAFTSDVIKFYPEDFCCGLWRQDLLYGLIWTADSTFQSSASQFVAPSWSWAASNDAVIFDEKDFQDRSDTESSADLLDVNIELASSLTPFGAVKSGKVTLRASVAGLPSPCYEPNSALYRKRQNDLEGAGRSINSLHSLSDRAISPEHSVRSAGARRSEYSDDEDHPGRWERSGYSDYGEPLGQEPASDPRSEDTGRSGRVIQSEYSDYYERLGREPACDPRSFSEQPEKGERGASTSGSLSPWDNDRDAASPGLESSENEEEMKPFEGLSDSHSDRPRCHHELSSEGFIKYEARDSSGRYMVDDRNSQSRSSSRGRDDRSYDLDDWTNRRELRRSRSRSRSLPRRYIVKDGEPRTRSSSRERDNRVEDSDDYWGNRREIQPSRSRSRSLPRRYIVKDGPPRTRSSSEERGPVVSECWRKVYWDHSENEIPTSDCQIIRLTDSWAMIVTPVRKFGTVGTAKGCTGSLYTRVGMLEILVVHEGMENHFRGAYGEEFKPLFEFDWSDDQVVTVM